MYIWVPVACFFLWYYRGFPLQTSQTMVVSEMLSALLMSFGLLIGIVIGAYIPLPPTFFGLLCFVATAALPITWVLRPPFELEGDGKHRSFLPSIVTFIGLPMYTGELGSLLLRMLYHSTLHFLDSEGIDGIYSTWGLVISAFLWAFFSIIFCSTRREIFTGQQCNGQQCFHEQSAQQEWKQQHHNKGNSDDQKQRPRSKKDS
ncbi:unnamed protein product [Heterosigma akashiwo]